MFCHQTMTCQRHSGLGVFDRFAQFFRVFANSRKCQLVSLLHFQLDSFFWSSQYGHGGGSDCVLNKSWLLRTFSAVHLFDHIDHMIDFLNPRVDVDEDNNEALLAYSKLPYCLQRECVSLLWIGNLKLPDSIKMCYSIDTEKKLRKGKVSQCQEW